MGRAGNVDPGSPMLRRVARDRGGRHRPAASSFHNREFQQGAKRVDKDGLFTDGMWDPTFAPSLRRLSQLGFSPNKIGGRGGAAGMGSTAGRRTHGWPCC